MKIKWLILLMAGACLLGCRSKVTFGINTSGPDKTHSSIDSAVADPDRREALHALINSYELEMKEIEAKAIAIRKEIVVANRDYDTSREELDALYGQLGALVVQMGAAAQRCSLEARTQCSQEEWKAITSHKTQPFNFTF